MLSSKLLKPSRDFPSGHIKALSILKPAALTATGGGGRVGGGVGGGADRARGNTNTNVALRNAIELGANGPMLLDLVNSVFQVEVVEVGVGVSGHDDVMPLVAVGDELVGVVFEAEEVGVRGEGEFVLDAFPGGEVGGVGVAVFPDGAPRGEDGAGGGGDDVLRRGEAAEEEGAEHEGVGGWGKGVELGGDVWVWGDEGCWGW